MRSRQRYSELKTHSSVDKKRAIATDSSILIDVAPVFTDKTKDLSTNNDAINLRNNNADDTAMLKSIWTLYVIALDNKITKSDCTCTLFKQNISYSK